MKITIEITSFENQSPANLLMELSEIINESKQGEINDIALGRELRWSGDAAEYRIKETA